MTPDLRLRVRERKAAAVQSSRRSRILICTEILTLGRKPMLSPDGRKTSDVWFLVVACVSITRSLSQARGLIFLGLVGSYENASRGKSIILTPLFSCRYSPAPPHPPDRGTSKVYSAHKVPTAGLPALTRTSRGNMPCSFAIVVLPLPLSRHCFPPHPARGLARVSQFHLQSLHWGEP